MYRQIEQWQKEDADPELVILWHCNFYDHMLSGVGTYRGQPVWIAIEKEGLWEPISTVPSDRTKLSRYELDSIDEPDEGDEENEDLSWGPDSTYAIYSLTDEQFQALFQSFEDFRDEYPWTWSDHRPVTERGRKTAREPKLRVTNDFCKPHLYLGTFPWYKFTNWFHDPPEIIKRVV